MSIRTRAFDTADDPAVFVPLRLTYGLVPLLAGIDKYFNLLADWEQYIAPQIRSAQLEPGA